MERRPKTLVDAVPGKNALVHRRISTKSTRKSVGLFCDCLSIGWRLSRTSRVAAHTTHRRAGGKQRRADTAERGGRGLGTGSRARCRRQGGPQEAGGGTRAARCVAFAGVFACVCCAPAAVCLRVCVVRQTQCFRYPDRRTNTQRAWLRISIFWLTPLGLERVRCVFVF